MNAVALNNATISPIWLILLLLAGLALLLALIGGAVVLVVWLVQRNRRNTTATPPVIPTSPVRPAAACPRCGVTLPPNSPQGLCPRCVLGVGLATQTEDQAGPTGTRIVKPPPGTPPALEEIARKFPQLEVIECLGRGGMGVVYKARQPKLNRFIALKILAPEKENDPKFADRFLREAQALARLNHPNIVAVHDFGETDGLYYLLMEYVDGVSLRHVMQSRKVAPEEALAIVPKICEALQFAHIKGVVHRDIKPENVLLDKEGQVKIADFGIAKIIGGEGSSLGLAPSGGSDPLKPELQTPANLTQGQVVGTPHYMAPEQVEKPQTVDHRADIYSLGVVFYELLTGELPLGKFAPPSKKVQVDVRLDEVVLRTLEKEPERRYQQASEVRSDVETIAATPPPLGNQSAETQTATGTDRRKRRLWLITTLGFLAGFTTFCLAFFAQNRGDRAGFWIWMVLNIGFTIAAIRCYRAAQAIVPRPGKSSASGTSFWHREVMSENQGNRWGAFVCYAAGLAIFAIGMWKLTTLDLDRTQLLFGVLLVVIASLLAVGLGTLMAHLAGRTSPEQAAINKAEWSHDRNWSAGMYFSKRDCRIVVPKRIPAMGWTVNLGRWQGVVAMFATFFAIVGLIIYAAFPSKTPNLTVTGYVLDVTTGEPIAGARVDDNVYGAAANHAPHTAWTDAEGHYELKTWNEEHNLAASARGYGSAIKLLHAQRGDAPVKIDFHLQSTKPEYWKTTPSEVKPTVTPGKSALPKRAVTNAIPANAASTAVPGAETKVTPAPIEKGPGPEEGGFAAQSATFPDPPAGAAMQRYHVRLASSAEFDMVPIRGGEFLMGSPDSEANRKPDEGPQHRVIIDPFWMQSCEVTWNQYELFMYPEQEKGSVSTNEGTDAVARPTKPYVEMSFGMGKDRFPAISMTQHAANKYCEWLSKKTGHFYRLPTEAEWEYACRAGTTTTYFFGNDSAQLGDYAWFVDNSQTPKDSENKYQKVGSKKPNPWGLYDMYGNVAEWCLDQYQADFYRTLKHVAVTPWNKATKPYPHVARGGGWDSDPDQCRSAARMKSDKSWKAQDPQLPKSIWYLTDAKFVGFRVVRPLKVPPPEEQSKYWNSGVERE